jgi:hypothetical protein
MCQTVSDNPFATTCFFLELFVDKRPTTGPGARGSPARQALLSGGAQPLGHSLVSGEQVRRRLKPHRQP